MLNFTNVLLSDKLINNICAHIEKLSKDINSSQQTINTLNQQGNGESPNVAVHTEQINFKLVLRRSFAECLFFACVNLQADKSIITTVFNTTKNSINLFNSAIENLIGDRQEDLLYDVVSLIDLLDVGSKSLFSIIYIEVATVMSLLDTKRKYNPKTSSEERTNTLYKNSQFVDEFDKQVIDLVKNVDDQGLSQRPQFEAIISLVWSLGLCEHAKLDSSRAESIVPRIEQAFDASLERDVFDFIAKGLLNSKMFRNEDEQTKDFIVFALSEMTCGVITTHTGLISDLLATQSERTRQFVNQRNDGRITDEDEEDISKPFNDLLLLLGELYREHPWYSHRFFDRKENPKLNDFITKTCCEHITFLCKLQEEIDLSFIFYMGALCTFSGDSVGATHVFQFLRNSPFPLFSWDYFFATLIPQFQAQCANNQDEVFDEKILDAIFVVLKLVERISKQSEDSRVAFIENNSWNVLSLFFNVMFVPRISPVLMGQVLSTLASFVKPSSGEPSQEALNILSQLERVQILKYEIRNETYEVLNSGGIKYQLNFRESQEGEYYETRGFLDLIDALISCTASPINGFTPYLKFIEEDVFNNFSKRFYKEESEKWLISRSCLEIFVKLLSRYTPSPNDFQSNNVNTQSMEDEKPISQRVDPPPGFQIMSDMLRDTVFRQQLFSLFVSDIDLHEERYNNREGEALEKTILLALQLIETVLLKEESFSQCSTSKIQANPLVIKPLEYQMRNSLIIKLADLLDYSFNNEIKYRVTNIFSLISKNRTNLVSLFKERQKDKDLVGLFVKNLFSVISESNKEQLDIEEISLNEEQMENETRLKMLELLKANVDAPGENITHLLCGFDIGNDEPREIDIFNERNCLTIVLQLLKSKRLPKTHPRFIESCYELIYKLCADRRVSQQTFACLEKANFLIEKLKNANFSSKIDESPLAHHILNQRAFVIRIVALKLHSNTKSYKKGGDSNRGGVQELVHILFGGDSLAEGTYNGFSGFGTLEQRRALMLEILDIIELNLLPPTTPPESKEWKLFLKNWSSVYNLFSGWKQVVEITLSQCFGMIPDDEVRLRILHDLMNSLLFKFSQMKSHQKTKKHLQIELLVSQVILRVMSKLREELIISGDTVMLPVDQCLTIFRNLLECTILADQSEQSTRGNLYSALINYLQYTKRNEVNVRNSQIHDLQKNNEHVLDRYIQIFDIISKDALDAKNVWKAVSYALLETLFAYTTNISQLSFWVSRFEKQGFLRQILESIMSESKHYLSKVLQPSVHESEANILNRLFIYENAMSMLLKFADVDAKSAEMMVMYEVIPKISANFSFIDSRPSIISHQYGRKTEDDDMEDDWEPSITEKYNQLVIPALKVIISIQSNLRQNKKVAEQVVCFVEKHKKAISSILKMENMHKSLMYIDINSLELVRLTTYLFYLLSLHQDVTTKRLSSTKFEGLMLSALVKLNVVQQLGASTRNTLDANLTNEGGKNREYELEYELEQKRCVLDEISKNIINYCRVVTQYPSIITPGLTGRILFTHFLSSKSVSSQVTDGDVLIPSSEPDQRPSLYALYLLLQNSYNRLNDALHERDMCDSNLQQLDQLKIEQLNNMVKSANVILGEEIFLSFFEKQDSVPNEAKLLCKTILMRKLVKLDSHLNTQINVLENTLVVFFRHLSFYLQSPPVDEEDTIMNGSSKYLGLSTEQRDQLIQEATTGSLNKLLDEILQLQVPKTFLVKETAADNTFYLSMSQRVKNLIFQNNSDQ